MRLSEVIAELRRRSEPVPRPARLPTAVEVAAVEATIGHTLPDDYRRFLLEASDVVLGTLEPATVTEPSTHTYLPRVIASARAYGVPKELLPICEDNADFYCLDLAGVVRFWAHDGAVDRSWPSLASWLEEVWLGARA
jgi:hypothetical protein